jgi:hypothetical protein
MAWAAWSSDMMNRMFGRAPAAAGAGAAVARRDIAARKTQKAITRSDGRDRGMMWSLPQGMIAEDAVGRKTD